jgi:Transposase DDE domain group 1
LTLQSSTVGHSRWEALPVRLSVLVFSDFHGGLLLVREVEDRLRVAERLAARIKDPGASDQITYSLADIIRIRLLMISAGYEDGNDASSLRSDPMFKMALDLAPSDRELCSQSTISRLENLPDSRTLLRMGRGLVDLYCWSFRQVPKGGVLDIDDMLDTDS